MCVFAINSDPVRGRKGETFNGFTVGQIVRVVSDQPCDRFYRSWTGKVWCFKDEEGTMMVAVKLLRRPDGTPAPIRDFDWFFPSGDDLRPIEQEKAVRKAMVRAAMRLATA